MTRSPAVMPCAMLVNVLVEARPVTALAPTSPDTGSRAYVSLLARFAVPTTNPCLRFCVMRLRCVVRDGERAREPDRKRDSRLRQDRDAVLDEVVLVAVGGLDVDSLADQERDSH